MTPSTTKASRIALAVAVVALLTTVAAAWVLDVLNPDDTYAVLVVQDDDRLAAFDVDALRAMQQRTVVAQDQVQEGPAVLDVLEKAGVREFDALTIRGAGIRDDGIIELDAQDVDRDVVLDFAERGTVKVCGPSIKWADRVRDVEVIEVR